MVGLHFWGHFHGLIWPGNTYTLTENNITAAEQHQCRVPVNSSEATYTWPSPHRVLGSEEPDPRSDC